MQRAERAERIAPFTLAAEITQRRKRRPGTPSPQGDAQEELRPDAADVMEYSVGCGSGTVPTMPSIRSTETFGAIRPGLRSRFSLT
jgi:hypothetical protein